MQFSTINRGEIPFFNTHQVEFCYHPEVYAAFINRPFKLASFEAQMEEKLANYHSSKRAILVDALKKQYSNIEMNPKVVANIDLLQHDNTFTVTTGHQLINFTGTFYFVLKVLNAVKLAEELKSAYPNQNFVPIYWMATEDHDYEEVKHVHLFGKVLTWETNQTGPVGRFDSSEFQEVIQAIKSLYANHPESEIQELLAIPTEGQYSDYFRQLVNRLFSDFGLVIIDGDDETLKQLFVPYMKQEVQHQIAIHNILPTNNALEAMGMKIQVNPREINLFYIGDGQRERLIALVDNQVEIPGKGTFSIEEALNEIEAHPKDYSPNVVLRPLYEEVILPNLCYIGGSGEINYWLQLKAMFHAFDVTFPILQTRISALYIDKGTAKKLNQMEMKWTELLPENHIIHRNFVSKNPETDIDFTTVDVPAQELAKALHATILSVDPNMQKYAEAEWTKLNKQLEQIKEKLFKLNKSKHESALKSIDQMREKLFPGNGLQERKWNLFHFLPSGDYSSFLIELKNAMEVFNPDLLVIHESIEEK